jgi:hypothetical protein
VPAVIVITARSLTLLAFSAIGIFAGIYWFVRGLRLRQRRRLILSTPASSIQNAVIGLVEVNGVSESPYVMLSPLNRTECHYYRAVAWQLRRSGHDTFWRKVVEETLHVPFYLNNGSGKLLVDPRGAEMDLPSTFQQEYHPSLPMPGSKIPGPVAEFLVRHGIDPQPGIKVEEYCIRPKSPLFALGTLSQNPGLDASITPAWAERVGEKRKTQEHPKNGEARNLTRVVRLSKPDAEVPAAAMTQQQKIAAALSRAGINNPAAWNSKEVGAKTSRPEPADSSIAVETAVEVTQRAETDDSESFDLHPPVVLMKGTHRPEFFISWRSPRELIQVVEWNSYLMILGGPALALSCAYLILRFRWL